MRRFPALAIVLLVALTAGAIPRVHVTYQGFPYKRTTCELPTFEIWSTITLPTAPVKEDKKVVVGWLYNGKTYKPGESFTIPEDDVEFVPVWGTQDIETVKEERLTIKELRDGQLIIVREGAKYNILGGRIR